jgi:quercetin dioxygenase-like cupin family protein
MLADHYEALQHASRRLLDALDQVAPGVVSYECDGGNATGVKLFSAPSVAVQSCHIPAGVKFSAHVHAEREHVILYRGLARIRVEGRADIELHVGDSVDVPPNITHTFEALEDCWCIGVTVPASPVYPK